MEKTIYCTRVTSDEKTFSKAILLLSQQRREKAMAIKNKGAQQRSIAAGLLLKYTLFMSGISDFNIKTTPRGKPFIDEINFSLSHSGEYAVCVVNNLPIGIDIQRVVEISQKARERFCTKRELDCIEKSQNPKETSALIWALKESWLKANDSDTKTAFATEFIINQDKTITPPKGCRVEVFYDIKDYIIAVCVLEDK